MKSKKSKGLQVLTSGATIGYPSITIRIMTLFNSSKRLKIVVNEYTAKYNPNWPYESW